MTGDLLERDDALDVLGAAVERAGAGSGSLVLLSGEAGIGKTSVVRAFAGRVRRDRVRVLTGACDDLVAPRAFGPLRDAGRDAEGLGRALRGLDREVVLPAVLAELAAGPTVLVVEDVHWADDATLDVLRWVGRRIEDLPAVVVVTFREEEVGDGLRRVLGALRGDGVHRVGLERLSRAAVARWAGGTNATSAALYRLTGGNPFFVSEALAADGEGGDAVAHAVPATVVDAVLARVRRLDPTTQAALEQLAVVPSRAETDLARALVGDLAVLAPAEQRGVLEVRPDAVAFRHELARRAVEDAVPTSVRMGLNARVLAALRERPDADRARLVHHAVGAGDDAAVVEFGPVAAAEAAHAGSHAQEVALHRQVLARGHLLPAADRAALLQALTASLFTLDRLDQAREAGEAAVALREGLGDPAQLGEALIPLGPVYWALTRPTDALATGERAVRLLSGGDDGPALAFAQAYRGLLLSTADRLDEARAVADDQIPRAQRLGVPALEALGRMLRAHCRLLTDDPAGLAEMAEARRLAAGAGHHVFVMYTCVLAAQDLWELGRFDEVAQLVEEGLGYAQERELALYVDHLTAHRHRLQGLHGRWDDAEAGLRALVGRPGAERAATRYALPGLARLLVRRGADDAEDVLAWALDYAGRADSRYELVPALLAAVEHAWLTGHPERAREPLARLTARTAGPGPARQRAEVLRWRRRLGDRVAAPEGCPSPWGDGLGGRYRDAADAWAAVDAPYEQALDLADADEPGPVLEALAILDDLGARPAAALVRRRLRTLGVVAIPRGPVPATRTNPQGLTDRQMTILRGLAAGRTNAEIADELVVSVRTVDHHVSAVLQKLGVTSRRAAAATARSLGIDRPDVPDPTRRTR